MMRHSIAIVLVAAACLALAATRTDEIPFSKQTLDLGASETCTVADINGDGRQDIVSGECWYEGPRWIKHKFRSLSYSNNYIDNFSDLAVDVNQDGRVDIVSCSYFTRKLVWMENPGKGEGLWKEHDIDSGFSGEFTFLVDLNNDGKALELLPQYGQADSPTVFYELSNGKYEKRLVNPKNQGHGIGAGDVNGDGRRDVLTPKGWFEAPNWLYHPDWSLPSTGFMFVLDINGDGRKDVFTTLAHDYGIFWLERGDGNTWTKRIIDDSWSQPHAVTMVDLNGDGRMEFVTGKRYMAHNGRDPGEREPLGIYWYEYMKTDDGKRVEWIKHIIDYSTRTGGGMQIAVADLDGDGDLDIITPGKSGLFLFENLTKNPRVPPGRRGFVRN